MKLVSRTFLMLLVTLLVCPPTGAQNGSPSDRVFRSPENEISLRYPNNWEPRIPQLASTILLLYAMDGSEATCNVNATSLRELKGLSEAKLDSLRKQSHGRPFFEKAFSKAFPGHVIVSTRLSHFGQLDAGVAEYRYELRVNDSRIQVQAVMAATFVNGRRYTLNCNAPPSGYGVAKKAFDYIRSTTLFMK